MTLRAAVAAALILAISAICDAPAFAGDALGRSLDGRLVADTDADVVVFWSLDCRACGAEMRAMENAGVSVVAINTDPASAASQVRSMARRMGIDGPVITDTDGSLQRRYQSRGGPEVLLIDGQGAVAWRQAGERMTTPEVMMRADRTSVASVD